MYGIQIKSTHKAMLTTKLQRKHENETTPKYKTHVNNFKTIQC